MKKIIHKKTDHIKVSESLKKAAMSVKEFSETFQNAVEIFRKTKTVFDELRKVKPINGYVKPKNI
jgi:hypothetical protein